MPETTDQPRDRGSVGIVEWCPTKCGRASVTCVKGPRRKEPAVARRALQAIITAVALFAVACSNGSDDEAAPTTVSPTTTAPAAGRDPIPVDWSDTADVALPNGWTVRDCEGDRTHVCIYEGTEFLGDIELLAGYPLEPAEDAGNPAALAETWARRMIEDFRADRARGCPAFTFTPLDVTATTVGGQPGARGGFKLTDQDGKVVEQVINHYVLVGKSMTILNTDAYAQSGGCLPPAEDSPSFIPEDLAELDRGSILDRIAAGSPVTPD